jgi:hypothetical protein
MARINSFFRRTTRVTMGFFSTAAGVIGSVVVLRGLSRRAKPVLVLKNSEYHVVNIGHSALRLCAVKSHNTSEASVHVSGVVLHPYGSVKIGSDYDIHYERPVSYDIVFQHLSPLGDSIAHTVTLEEIYNPGILTYVHTDKT